MGHGPKLGNAIKDNTAARNAVNAAVKQAEAELKNTEAKAKAFINSHTKGIVDIKASNANSYSKFSEEYSLKVLDTIVDGIVDGAKTYLDPTNEATKAAKLAEDAGTIVKGILALFSTSSSVNENVQVTFNQIQAADGTNWAVYYACSSMSVKAENAWGNKDIIVVSNMYLLATVKPNPEATYEKMLQQDLDTLLTLNEQFDKAIIDARTEGDLDNLKFYQEKLNMEQEKIKKELELIGA
ncbi:hypothetical protein [Flagellimonas nanhaiensis]|nr:hypothetical protein [Allomuricauda nanhaiensis]